MDVELLTVPECPNRALARQRIADAFSAIGCALPVVVEREIDSLQEAVAAGMHGSPTILVDGKDHFAVADDQPSLSCRLYATGEVLAGAPSVEDLVVILSRGGRRDR